MVLDGKSAQEYPFNVGMLKHIFLKCEDMVVFQLQSFCYKNNFIRTKALILAKKIKNKLRTKPGLLSHRTQEQSF